MKFFLVLFFFSLFFFISHAQFICDNEIDIILLITTATNISPVVFNILKNSLFNFFSLYNIGPESVNVAIITYSTFANIELDFSSNKSEVLSVLNNLSQNPGYTNIQDALKNAYIKSFEGRKNVPSLIYLYMDSYPTTNNGTPYFNNNLFLREDCILMANLTMSNSVILTTAIFDISVHKTVEPFVSSISNTYFLTSSFNVMTYNQQYIDSLCYLTNVTTNSPNNQPTIHPSLFPTYLTHFPTKMPTIRIYTPTTQPLKFNSQKHILLNTLNNNIKRKLLR